MASRGGAIGTRHQLPATDTMQNIIYSTNPLPLTEDDLNLIGGGGDDADIPQQPNLHQISGIGGRRNSLDNSF